MVATIYIPDDLAEIARQLVASGEYPGTDAVLREAMALLEQQRESRRLWQSILDADRSIDEGRGIPWNEETKARILREAHEQFLKRTPPKPDVTP